MAADVAVGIDGYAGGWVAVALVEERFADCVAGGALDALLGEWPAAAAIAVDIPIGPPRGADPRPADLAAKAFLATRPSSVFVTFPAAVYREPNHAAAAIVARELTGRGISRQAYALGTKIREAEAIAAADERIVEVHPEVSFQELAGEALRYPKRSWNGSTERRALLERAGIRIPVELERAARVPADDVLDAAIASWSAARYAKREAAPLPADHTERIGAIWR